MAEVIENASEVLSMEEAIENLMVAIKSDYYDFVFKLNVPIEGRTDEEQNKISATMAARFNDGLTYKVGKKYIKVIKDGSVWGFIVNTDNDKQFNYGDILKAASWATPARNKARGNIFALDKADFHWTGPGYLR